MFEFALGNLNFDDISIVSGSILRIYLSEFDKKNIYYIGKDIPISKSRSREKFIALQSSKDKGRTVSIAKLRMRSRSTIPKYINIYKPVVRVMNTYYLIEIKIAAKKSVSSVHTRIFLSLPCIGLSFSQKMVDLAKLIF